MAPGRIWAAAHGKMNNIDQTTPNPVVSVAMAAPARNDMPKAGASISRMAASLATFRLTRSAGGSRAISQKIHSEASGAPMSGNNRKKLTGSLAKPVKP